VSAVRRTVKFTLESAYVAGALRQAQVRESLRDVLDSWDAELGQPDRATRAWAKRQLRRVDG
jgi:hypothetical protein